MLAKISIRDIEGISKSLFDEDSSVLQAIDELQNKGLVRRDGLKTKNLSRISKAWRGAITVGIGFEPVMAKYDETSEANDGGRAYLSYAAIRQLCKGVFLLNRLVPLCDTQRGWKKRNQKMQNAIDVVKAEGLIQQAAAYIKTAESEGKKLPLTEEIVAGVTRLIEDALAKADESKGNYKDVWGKI